MKESTQKELKEMNKTVLTTCLISGKKIMVVKGKPRETPIIFVALSLTYSESGTWLFSKSEIGEAFIKVEDAGAKLRQVAFKLIKRNFQSMNWFLLGTDSETWWMIMVCDQGYRLSGEFVILRW
jgi:hypothetical protein